MMCLLQIIAESNQTKMHESNQTKMAEINQTEMAESNQNEMDEGYQSLTSPVLAPLSQAEKVNEM